MIPGGLSEVNGGIPGGIPPDLTETYSSSVQMM